MTFHFCTEMVAADLMMIGLAALFRSHSLNHWGFVLGRDITYLILFSLAGWWLKP
jgi:hypothetical protein